MQKWNAFLICVLPHSWMGIKMEDVDVECFSRLPKRKPADDCDSAFEYDSEHERAKAKRKDLTTKDKARIKNESIRNNYLSNEYSRNEAISHRFHQSGLDAYSRHKLLINEYILYRKGATTLLRRDTSRDRTDLDIIRENHRFLWSDEDEKGLTWGQEMAKKYYDKLFKEYCIADLSRYKENKIAMRWRVEKEVVDGKGQFECGNKLCSQKEDLRSWEVNFGYVELGIKKNSLVKLRLCPECSFKLNYGHKRKEVKRSRKQKRTKSSDGDALSKGPTSDESSSEVQETKTKDGESSSVSEEAESEIWKAPVKLDEKSREEEFDDYFDGLFL